MTSVRQDPASTGASVCSAPTRPSMGASRPPSPAPSASAMLRGSCAAARRALRVSSLPASRIAGPPVSKCTEGCWAGFKLLSLGLSLPSYKMGLPWLGGHRWEPQLGLLQGTTAAWTWTSVPQGHASMEAAARTCPMAFSVTVQMATQVLGDGVGTGAGQGRSWWARDAKFPVADR